MADHLRHEVNGLAYPPADVDQMAKGMVRLALDRAESVRLGRGARVTAAQLSWSAELDRLDALYRGILPEQADRTPAVAVAVA